MELESLEGGQVGLIVHLVRVRTERSFHPFLEERFFFEVAQLARRFPFFSGTLGDSIVGGERRIHPPKHHPLIGTMRILETARSEEHTSELQSHSDLVCRLLLEKKKTKHAVIDSA